MAIIVKNVKITPSPTPPVVDRSYEVSVEASGKVDVGENGLDLGCQGDHNITKLEFNVSALKHIKEHIKSLNNYNPVLVFSRKKADNTIENISCPGVNNIDSKTSIFYIPEDVTEIAGEYSILFTLREKDENDGNVNITNDTGGIKEKEFFISNEFKGVVRESIFGDLDASITVKDENDKEVKFSTSLLPKLVKKRTEKIQTNNGIYKKKIALTWPRGEGYIQINGDEDASGKNYDNLLGNKYDVFMTYITIDHPFYHEQSTGNKDNEIFVIFISNDKDKINYAVITTADIITTDTDEKLAAVWVPAEVTVSDRKDWKVGFVGLQEDNSTGGYSSASYSPTTDFILNQNFLSETDEDDIDIEQAAEVALMSFDGELQTKEKDDTVYTTTVYSARNTAYSLGMSGDDVKRRLETVDVLNNDMNELQGSSANSIQGKLYESIRTHNGSPDAHENLVRAGVSDVEEYKNYKGKNTVEGIVDVIRSEMAGRVGLTIKDVQDQISIHNTSTESHEDIRQSIDDKIAAHNNTNSDDVHPSLVQKVTATATLLTQEINRVEGLITNVETRVESLKNEFNAFDTIYVNESELTEALNTRVLGFDPLDIEEGATYGSYTVKKLKDESDTRLSETYVKIAEVNVKAEEARATANQANQTAANAYEAVTTTIQNKADKTEVQALNTKLDTELAKNTKEHEAINKKITDDLAAARIEIDAQITKAVTDAEYDLGLVDTQLQGQINAVKESIKTLGSNETTINTRLSAAETEISSLNIKVNGLDNTYATDAALESVKSDLRVLENKQTQDVTNLENAVNALKGAEFVEGTTISSIDSKADTIASDLETYKVDTNASITSINASIGGLAAADTQLQEDMGNKLEKTAQIQSIGRIFNSEEEWEAFKTNAEAATLYFVLEEE